MSTFILKFLLLLALFSSASAREFTYFTTDTLIEDLNTFEFAIPLYFTAGGPLDKNTGLIGSAGPLGALGPFGTGLQNVTSYYRNVGNWENYSEILTLMGGPLSENGPLSIITDTESGQGYFDYWQDNIFSGTPYSSFFKSFRPGMPLHILGLGGAMSPLSVMGPMGPHGSTGFEQNEFGDFINQDGQFMSGKWLELEDGPFLAPLFEYYSTDDSASVSSEDSFFALDSFVRVFRPTKKLEFASKREQWVSILLVGQYTLDTFSISLIDKISGEIIATSKNLFLSNFIVFRTPKNQKYEIEVKLESTFHFISQKKFRVFVTGTTERLRYFKGDHHRLKNIN